MRLNTTTGRLVTIAVAFFAVLGIVAFGGRAYLGHLSDPPAEPADTAAEVVDLTEAEADPVGTCYTLADDTRSDATDGAVHWDVVHCSRTHTAEVVAIVSLADTDLDGDPSTWGTAELGAATQACADAVAADAGTLDGDGDVLSAAVRGEDLMCVATSTPHRHIDGERVDVPE